jgi:hypothetical protein
MVEGRVTRDLRNEIYGHLLRLGFPSSSARAPGRSSPRHQRRGPDAGAGHGNLSKAISSSPPGRLLPGFLLLISWRLTLVAALFLPADAGALGALPEAAAAGVLRVLDAVGERRVADAGDGQRDPAGQGVRRGGVGEPPLPGADARALQGADPQRAVAQFFPPATEMITAVAVSALLWYGSYLVLEEGTLGGPPS